MKKRRKPADASDGCLLTYLAATSPLPIQVSTPATAVTGTVNTAALNEGKQPVYCNEIVIAVPVGPDPNELFAATPTASVNTGKWAISSMEIKSAQDLGLDGDVSYATFTFDCRDASDYEINYNLVFGVQGQVSQLTGDSTIQIQETSGTTNDPNSFTTKTTSYVVTAYTPQFYLQNLMASVPTAPTVPATEFTNGADIRLSWESNGTYFEIYEKGNSTPIYSGSQTNYTVTGGVATDTTFVLVAMMSGNPSGDQPSSGYAPIYLYEALSITISNPDLTPKSAAISGNASVGGTLGVTGNTSLAIANVSGTLGVSGNTSLGSASVGGTLGVTGQTNLANTIVGGTLTANGSTTLSGTNVSGTLGVSGAANLTGGLTATSSLISLLTGAQSINPGSYTANTDGFVIGVVIAPPQANRQSLCVTYINGWNSDGASVAAIGGNVGCFDSSWNKASAPNNSTFMLPVRNGNTWGVSATNDPSNQSNASTAFYWVPLGTASSGNTLEKISDEQREFDYGMARRRPLRSDKYILELVEIIETMLGSPIERLLRKRLIEVLLKMQVEEYENVDFDGRIL